MGSGLRRNDGYFESRPYFQTATIVIASAAKQSIAQQKESWIASLRSQ
jgi:hypothetical protein